MCMWVCGCICVWVRERVGGEILCVLPITFHFVPLRQDVSLDLERTILGKLTGQLVPGTLPPPPSCAGVPDTCSHTVLLLRV